MAASPRDNTCGAGRPVAEERPELVLPEWSAWTALILGCSYCCASWSWTDVLNKLDSKVIFLFLFFFKQKRSTGRSWLNTRQRTLWSQNRTGISLRDQRITVGRSSRPLPCVLLQNHPLSYPWTHSVQSTAFRGSFPNGGFCGVQILHMPARFEYQRRQNYFITPTFHLRQILATNS